MCVTLFVLTFVVVGGIICLCRIPREYQGLMHLPGAAFTYRSLARRDKVWQQHSKTHAVDQKKAKGKHIRDMVKLADLEGLKNASSSERLHPAAFAKQASIHCVLSWSLTRLQVKDLGGSSVNSRYAEQF